jgi:hypothetical protein
MISQAALRIIELGKKSQRAVVQVLFFIEQFKVEI